MAASPTLTLAEFASGLRREDIPSAVARHAQRLVLDAVGCGLFGSSLPPSRILGESLAIHGRGGDVAVWGREFRLSLFDAVLANGSAVTAGRMDDVHKDAMMHAGAVIVPPCLALAESWGPVGGQEVLTAVVAGCEVGARVGLAAGYGMMRRGFEPASFTGTFCAAAAAGRLLRLAPDAMRDALGVAGTFGAGLMGAQRGSMVLPMHAGRAAQSGTYGALLAQRGFTGIRDILEAPYGGFVSTVTDEPRWEQLTLGLGDVWQTAGVSFKLYPCGASTHTAIDCVMQLRGRHPELRPREVESIVIATTTITRDHGGWPFDRGEGPGAARLNIPWCAAVALARGGVSVEDFTESALDDGDLQDLARRVRVVADPDLDAAGLADRHAVRLTLRTSAGANYTAAATHSKGSLAGEVNETDLTAKFSDLAGRVLGAERAARLAEALWDLPACADVGALARSLAVA